MGVIKDKISTQEADAAVDAVALDFKNTKERMYRTLEAAKGFPKEILNLKNRAAAAGADEEDQAHIDTLYDTIRGGVMILLDELPPLEGEGENTGDSMMSAATNMGQ
jgi:hypothetical protein